MLEQVSPNNILIQSPVLKITIIPDQGSSYAVALIDPYGHISLVASSLPLLTLAAEYIHSITSILNGRFLLALHETNARLEGAADASISSLSLGTVSSNDPRASAPVLPQFLGPIGGHIRSFSDDSYNDDLDSDVESVDFALASQDWSQSEFEVGPESDGDGGNAA